MTTLADAFSPCTTARARQTPLGFAASILAAVVIFGLFLVLLHAG